MSMEWIDASQQSAPYGEEQGVLDKDLLKLTPTTTSLPPRPPIFFCA